MSQESNNNDNTPPGAFGRNEMFALLGGDLPDRLTRASAIESLPGTMIPRSKKTKAQRDVADMTTAETAAWLLEQQKNKGPSLPAPSTQRHRTQKIRQYHSLLLEEQERLLEQQKQHQQQRQRLQQQQKPTDRSNQEDESDDEINNRFLTERHRGQKATSDSSASHHPTSGISRRRRSDSNGSSGGSSTSGSDSSSSPRRSRRLRRQDSTSSDEGSTDDDKDEQRQQRLLRVRNCQIVVTTDPWNEPENHQMPPRPTTAVVEVPGVATEQMQDEKLRKPQLNQGAEKSPQQDNISDSDNNIRDNSSAKSDSDDDDTDSSEDEESVVAKPIYVPRHKRGTIKSVEDLEEEERAKEEKRKVVEEKRKIESRIMVQQLIQTGTSKNESISLDDEITGARNAIPDDDDDASVDRLQDEWEVRELERMVQLVDTEVARQREQQELDRRRKMTDEERLNEDLKAGRYKRPGIQREIVQDSAKSKKHLQRYYHRGAFYMDEKEWDEGDIRGKARDYAVAVTGSDKIDRDILPKVMQVKNFGRANQNRKYKGLSAEDTSDKRMEMLPLVNSKGIIAKNTKK